MGEPDKPPRVPTYTLDPNRPLAAEGLRSYAALLLATGEVDAAVIERLYSIADEMDEWAAHNGTVPFPPPPPVEIVEEGP